MSNYQIPGATKKLLKYAEINEPEVIIGVYPDYYFLKIARDAAKQLNIPFVAYLHDTIAEAAFGTRLEREALKLQEEVFNEASALLVMSDGMRDLYKQKYNIKSIPLQHTYLEEIKVKNKNLNTLKQAFWGGDVYAINLNSVSRVNEALKKIGYKFFLATGHEREHFQKTGLDISNLKTGFFSKRDEYLDYLKRNSLLVLALDWPDETKIHRDELATIFPTKTPEYLASGVPILVHCPEDYFMSRFFKEKGCGIVVNDKSIENLKYEIEKVFIQPEQLMTIQENAFKAAELFNANKLAAKFKSIIDDVSGLTWSEKIDYSKYKIN